MKKYSFKIIGLILLLSSLFVMIGCSKKVSVGQQALDVAHAYQNGEIDAENATIQLMQLEHQTDDKKLASAIADVYLNIQGIGFFDDAPKKLTKAIENLEVMTGNKAGTTNTTGCNGIDVSFVDLRSTGDVNQGFDTNQWSYNILSYDLGFPDRYKDNGNGYMCIKVHVKNNSSETLRPLENNGITFYGDGKKMGSSYMDFYGNGLTMSQDYHMELLGGSEGDAYLVYSFEENSIPKHIVVQYGGETIIEYDIK